MCKLSMLLVILLVVATPLVALGQCPSNAGVFRTSDGTLLVGRASEAWCTGTPGVPGNTENAMSWDGMTLGTQWKAWGMEIDADGAVETGRSLDAEGSGWIEYRTYYDGGEFWLSADHGWSDGIDAPSGPIDSYVVSTMVYYFQGSMTGAVSNISFTGTFADCPEMNECRIEFAIATAMLVWSSATGQPAPADYPDFLCGATGGEYFDASGVMISINCLIPTETSTWGAIKRTWR